MATYRVMNIEYDTDGEAVDLPTTMVITIDDDADVEEAIVEEVSGQTGWCVLELDFVKMEP